MKITKLSLPLPMGCEARCRACRHRRWTASASETHKHAWLAQQLAPWVECLQPLQGVAGARRWGYRDKVALGARWEEATWQFGLGSREDFIAIPHCPVHTPRVRAVCQALAAVLPPAAEFPLAYYVQAGGQATLIIKAAPLPSTPWLTTELMAEFRAVGLEGLWLHGFPAAGRRLFHKNHWRLLWGEPHSRDSLGLLHGPTAFQQLLPELYRTALDRAEAFLRPAPDHAVVDLYCGSGASLQRWTAQGAATIGVELGGEAVDYARHNAPAALILRGTCAARLPQLDVWLADHPRWSIYLNPPRTGLEPEVLHWVQTRQPERIAYLSCSAGTLGRDLQALHGQYRVDALYPFDFFPQTYHVETLALLHHDQHPIDV